MLNPECDVASRTFVGTNPHFPGAGLSISNS